MISVEDDARALVRRFGSPAELFDLDGAGSLRRLAANDAAGELAPLSLEPTELFGMAARRCLLEGVPREVLISRANFGGERVLRHSLLPLFDTERRPVSVLCVAPEDERLIDERQRLAAERRRQQMESLGQLAGGVAHEFNNLLVPITMLSKMALARIGDDETLKLFLTTIHESGWKAARIVRSVLTYARQMMPTAGPLACGEVIAERIQLLRQALPPSLVFDIAIADTTTRVLGNAGELSQIIVNLFNNANEAVGDYGTIRCSVVRVPLTAKARGLTGLTTAEAMEIVVADTGPGITPDIRERIFQPFFTTKPIGQGTGLGLSVVEGIVKEWGGHISVASAPGTGAVFTILLPVVE